MHSRIKLELYTWGQSVTLWNGVSYSTTPQSTFNCSPFNLPPLSLRLFRDADFFIEFQHTQGIIKILTHTCCSYSLFVPFCSGFFFFLRRKFSFKVFHLFFRWFFADFFFTIWLFFSCFSSTYYLVPLVVNWRFVKIKTIKIFCEQHQLLTAWKKDLIRFVS